MNNKVLNSTTSPHLGLVLDQLAKLGEIDEPTAEIILQNFEKALALKGLSEIGFQRKPHQSFNPRAARILLILLNDARIRQKEELLLALERAGLGPDYKSYLSLEQPLVVSGAFLLDRLRHLHQEFEPDAEKVYEACLKAQVLLTSEFPQLSVLLEKGVERMKRNLR